MAIEAFIHFQKPKMSFLILQLSAHELYDIPSILNQISIQFPLKFPKVNVIRNDIISSPHSSIHSFHGYQSYTCYFIARYLDVITTFAIKVIWIGCSIYLYI